MKANLIPLYFKSAPDEEFTVPVTAVHLADLCRRREPFDVILLAVKSYDTEWATVLIAPYLSAGGVVVSLQNCINEERIAAAYPPGMSYIGMFTSVFTSEKTAGAYRLLDPAKGER